MPVAKRMEFIRTCNFGHKSLARRICLLVRPSKDFPRFFFPPKQPMVGLTKTEKCSSHQTKPFGKGIGHTDGGRDAVQDTDALFALPRNPCLHVFFLLNASKGTPSTSPCSNPNLNLQSASIWPLQDLVMFFYQTNGFAEFCSTWIHDCCWILGRRDSAVSCRFSQGLDHFVSHDWGTSRFLKVVALLVTFNTATSLNLRIISCV